MANLISNPERQSYVAAMQDVHDSFARDVIGYKQSAETIVSQNDNFDAFYDKPPQVVYTSTSKIIKARVKYIDRADKDFVNSSNQNQINVSQDKNIVRIKVTEEDGEYLKSCVKISVDNEDFVILSSVRPHGLFNTDFYTFFLVSSD